MDTLENKTARTVLQQAVTVEIGDENYDVAPPTIATLILASAAISQLPKIKLDNEKIASECLSIAKDCEVLGEIVAILILGAKGLKESRRSFFGLKTIEIDKQADLAKKILCELSPKQLHDLFAKLLTGMDLAFFFATTASLIEINLLRATKEMEETTASGR